MLVPMSVWSCVHMMCSVCVCVHVCVYKCVCMGGGGGVGECMLCVCV